MADTQEPLDRHDAAARTAGDASQLESLLVAHSGSSSLLRVMMSAGPVRTPGNPVLLASLETTFASIAHAAKNFLSPIRGYASLIQDEAGDTSNARRWADKIEHSVEQLERYLERIALLRVHGGTPALCSWSQMLRSVEEKVAPVNPAAITITSNVANEAPFLQRPDVLTRILFQLVRNGVESCGPDGAVDVRVDERRVAGGGGIVREFTVAVADSGDGIKRENIEMVWQPFFSTRHDHLGMGLSFVAAAAAAMDLNVNLESEAGRGTTVTLVLREQGGQS